jgi:lipid-binding SYLF domain-containing protein
MKKIITIMTVLLITAATAAVLIVPRPALAANAKEIDRESRAALQTLYEKTPLAKVLGDKAKAILVFPGILKAGFFVGAEGGNGAMLVNGKTEGYYNMAAASWGFQAGAQEFGYALFLMSDSARAYIDKSDGWEVGGGPSVVFVDTGLAKSLTTTTAKDDVYAFIFNQKGLMAGVGIQGSKITKIKP